MSEDRPIVNPFPRRNSDGTTTITTEDAGDIRLLCPSWCVVQHGYRYQPMKADITHRGEPEWALVDTPETGPTSLVEVGLIQWPFGDHRQVFLSVATDDGDKEVGPTAARQVAEALRRHAAHIDTMAGVLEALRAVEL
ncbi:DUF6907 domain-containing protein [Streptomyces drozdowiczii]|uniref:DUF6907 domain-containing protein n=1 Tax=Streptomyces drozdowiczii TaxID=202862 RepID=UPI00403CFDC6